MTPLIPPDKMRARGDRSAQVGCVCFQTDFMKHRLPFIFKPRAASMRDHLESEVHAQVYYKCC